MSHLQGTAEAMHIGLDEVDAGVESDAEER
jgi:hypothetical protein